MANDDPQNDFQPQPEREDELLEPGQPAPTDAPPVSDEVLATPSQGLERHPQPQKRVIIVGGGIAGLVAGFELMRQGHEPLILEAQHRVGGRVYTLRNFAPGLYAEAGAMRIPRVHNLTFEYCRLFGLEMRPFIMGNPRSFVHLGGLQMTFAEANADPGRLPFELAEHEKGRTWDEMWNEAVADVREMYEQGGEQAWPDIVAKYDQYSIHEFLKMRGFSDGAIELYGVMSFREQNMNAAVIEQFHEVVGKSFEDMQEIAGGMDLLPNAFYERMPQQVRFGAEVNAIEQDDHGVTVHYRTGSGRFSVNGDYAIVTVPFPVLRDIEVTPAFSREKQKAIRELNYNASTKILFQVRHRFWEGEEFGIIGGTTATDMPIRRIVYPSFSDPSQERGMLLASYTWAQDALRWGSMNEEDRVEQALEDVAKIHPEIVEEFEVGASHAWYSDPYAGGAFALFEPEQQTLLQDHIVAPEGRIHFAGEHCSLYHAWIQGALESGIRAANAIHQAPAAMTARTDPE
ncbi:MAG TPA: amine oxidase [Actinobacteria bacterium]|jgi:monoamine oxidase|nr:amine oxidase [Actinomycetota bacterium]HCP61647.1 amine oxidase [Actinomycetota bacterium]